MTYFDIVTDVCDKNDFEAFVEDDGDNPGEQVFIICDYRQENEIEAAIRDALIDTGVDVSNVTNAIDFATDYNWLYHDDTFTCENCFLTYRTGDYANYFVDDGMVFCKNCVNDDEDIRDVYLETLINVPTEANTILPDEVFEDMGFTSWGSTYESGLYGRNDSPTRILDEILGHYPDAEVVFSIVQTHNPFATRFHTYVRYNEPVDDFDEDDEY